MKTRFLLLLSVFCISMQAQTVRYDFDADGNLSVHIGDLFIQPRTSIEEISAVLGKPAITYTDSGNWIAPKDSSGQQVIKYKYAYFVFSEKGIEFIRDEYSGKWKEVDVFFSEEKQKVKTKKFTGTLIFNGDTINASESHNHFVSNKYQSQGWYFMKGMIYQRGKKSAAIFNFNKRNRIHSVLAQWDADIL